MADENNQDFASMQEAFGLKGAAIADYPMYRGLAKLIGMEPLETGSSLYKKINTLAHNWEDYDFFYVHAKRCDTAGEDGDANHKGTLIEEADGVVARILSQKPDAVMVTGDHSTPCVLKAHSWHPVPVVIWSPQCRPDGVNKFGERQCLQGALGPRFPATDLMTLLLAHAGRLAKFGA